MRINNAAREENKWETWMLFSSNSHAVFPLHRLGCCGRVSIHYFLTWPTFIHPFIAPRIFRLPRAVCRVELPWLFLISLRIAVSRRFLFIFLFLSFFRNEKIKKNNFLARRTVLVPSNPKLWKCVEISKFLSTFLIWFLFCDTTCHDWEGKEFLKYFSIIIFA